MSASKSTVKNPVQRSSRGFVVTMIAVLAALAAAVTVFIWKSPSGMEAVGSQFEKDSTSMQVKESDGVVTMANNPNENAKEIDIYEDFSCTYCAQLATATDMDMFSGIESGDLIVNIHTLNFLDGDVKEDKAHSTASFAPALAMARDGQAEQYWNYRKFMLQNFESVYGAWNGEDLSKVLVNNVGIDAKYVDLANDNDSTDEAFDVATSNIQNLLDRTGDTKPSSPQVFWGDYKFGQDGIPVQAWVEMVMSTPAKTFDEMVEQAEQDVAEQ